MSTSLGLITLFTKNGSGCDYNTITFECGTSLHSLACPKARLHIAFDIAEGWFVPSYCCRYYCSNIVAVVAVVFKTERMLLQYWLYYYTLLYCDIRQYEL